MGEYDSLDVAHQAGEFHLDYAEVLFAGAESGIDISQQIDSMNFYEDLYAGFISGKITLRDTQDLPNFFGRAGKDILRISIKTKGIPESDKNKITGYYHIYKLGDRELVGDRMQMYSLYIMSIEHMTDMNTNISRAYAGTGDEIFLEIAKKYLKDQTKAFITDKSSAQIKFVSNFWSPSKCISYSASHSVSPNAKHPFLFYESRDGFCFRDLSVLYSQNTMQTFQENDFSVGVNTEGSIQFGIAKRDPDKDYKVVQAIRVDAVYDYISARHSGAIKSKLTAYDLLKKSYSVTDYSVRGPQMNSNPLFPSAVVESTSPPRSFMSKHYDNLDFGNGTNSAYIQHQVSDFRLLNGSKIEIDVFGRTDYTVGKTVYYDSNLKAPISADDKPHEFEDKLFSGKYLITAINHRFNRSRHFCTIELSKESSKLK